MNNGRNTTPLYFLSDSALKKTLKITKWCVKVNLSTREAVIPIWNKKESQFLNNIIYCVKAVSWVVKIINSNNKLTDTKAEPLRSLWIKNCSPLPLSCLHYRNVSMPQKMKEGVQYVLQVLLKWHKQKTYPMTIRHIMVHMYLSCIHSQKAPNKWPCFHQQQLFAVAATKCSFTN